MMTPARIAETGFVVVDATWGTIHPLTLGTGVVTVGELEVIEQLDGGLAVIDTRPASAYAHSTIPGARNLPHEIGGWQGRICPKRSFFVLVGYRAARSVRPAPSTVPPRPLGVTSPPW